MKVTKLNQSKHKKVMAFLSEKVVYFRNNSDDKNTILNSYGTSRGGMTFDSLHSWAKDQKDFIEFFEGDTIQIELGVHND